MLSQGKLFQAEIDAACEFADFFRLTVLRQEIHAQQPEAPMAFERLEYRPLEGLCSQSPIQLHSHCRQLPAVAA